MRRAGRICYGHALLQLRCAILHASAVNDIIFFIGAGVTHKVGLLMALHPSLGYSYTQAVGAFESAATFRASDSLQ